MKYTHRIPWGAPYAYTEIEYDVDAEHPEPTQEEMLLAVETAVLTEEAWKSLSERQQPPEPDEPAREDDGRQTYSRPPQRAQQRAPMGRPREHDAPAYCPEHNGAPCQFSAARYNPDGDKMYHALDARDWYQLDDGRTAKNHTLWWRLTVDADGNSNADRAMPAAGRR